MTSTNSTQKITILAAQIDSYGDTSNIVVNDVPTPKIAEGKVLVKVAAAGLNPFDIFVLEGHAKPPSDTSFPLTLGQDFVGTIVEVGSGVEHFTVGEKVYGTANALYGGSGAFAEYVVASETNTAHAPKTLNSTESATLPTAAATALQAINNLNIQKNDKLFIHGGAGGVGSFAIQIAKHRGAHVTVTASASNRNYVQSIGADEVINYEQQNFQDFLHDYDKALNAVRDSADKVLTTVKRGGTAVSLTEPFNDAVAAQRSVTAIHQSTKITSQLLTELADLVDRGVFKPHVERTFTLSDIRNAYTTLSNHSGRGKIVIDIPQ